MKKLTDRTAVVTGAGSGIGRATAVLLAKQGCRLAIADINAQGLDETARLVREVGRPVTTHVVNVADKARMQELTTEVVDAHGAVHILINNAGVAVVSDFQDHSLEDFEWLMGINFWGVVYGCKFFLPQLTLADEAHIVNISSLFGLVGIPQQTSYCASKFAVRGFSESLRIELAASNIGVTSVHPGGIATRIVEDARLAGSAQNPKAHAALVKSFKKMMPPEEAAACILRGIQRNKPRVLITRESYVGDIVKRVAPAFSTDVMAWGYERYKEKRAAKLAAR